MTWCVFYLDQTGDGLSETCPDWRTAFETCHGFIDMVNPQHSGVTFHRELDRVEPDHSFHATDGIYQFAIEEVSLKQ